MVPAKALAKGQNMLNGMRIFVISLKDSSDRRAHINQHLSQKGLKYDLFEGIDGYELSLEESKKFSSNRSAKELGRALRRGEMGCALSHISLYEKLLESEENEFLILEDDAELTDAALQVLDRREKFPNDWDLINLHCLADHFPFGDPIWDTYRLATFRALPTRLTAYLISRSGAAKLLKHAFPIGLPADLLTARLADTGRLNMYGVSPQVASSRPMLSTIGPRRTFRLFKDNGQLRKITRIWLQKLVWRI